MIIRFSAELPTFMPLFLTGKSTFKSDDSTEKGTVTAQRQTESAVSLCLICTTGQAGRGDSNYGYGHNL